jgi:hypothetical protein
MGRRRGGKKMSFESWLTSDLAKLLTRGGGIELDVKDRPVAELEQLAVSAKIGGARLILCGMAGHAKEEIMDIAIRGGGYVSFS